MLLYVSDAASTFFWPSGQVKPTADRAFVAHLWSVVGMSLGDVASLVPGFVSGLIQTLVQTRLLRYLNRHLAPDAVIT